MGEAVPNPHEQQLEAGALEAATAEARDVGELPEELVDSLGMISLANAAEMHRGKETEDGGPTYMASEAASRGLQQQQHQQHPLPPASTLLNLSACFSGSDQVFPLSTTSVSPMTTTTTCFSDPIEVVTSDAVDLDPQSSLPSQMTQLANYPYLPSTTFDYFRLYDSQMSNHSSSATVADGVHDQNGFTANEFYEFQS